MLTETGRVVALEGTAVWVETVRSSACGQCAARSGCGHDLMNRVAAGSSRAIVRARRSNDLSTPLAVHDSVTLSLPDRSFLQAATMLYLVPLLCMMAAAVGANAMFGSGDLAPASADLGVGFCALAGLGVGLGLIRLASRTLMSDQRFEPLVTSKI